MNDASYKWVIVGQSALVNFLAWSMRSTFALFYVAMLNEFGWRRGEAAVGYSLSWLLILGFGPVAGRLHDRFGAHVVVPLGALFLGTGLALTGAVQTLWQYYLSFGVLGGAGVAFMMMPAIASVSHWFMQSRGTAMGIISAGSSASAVLFYPLNTWLIEQLGWRQAIGIYGLIVILGAGPLSAYLYRRQPGGVEMESDDEGRTKRYSLCREEETLADRPHAREWTLRAAMFTMPFWAAFSMWGLGVIGYQIMTTHQVAHALGQGFDARTVAWVFGLAGMFTTIGNLIGGALSDRWGRAWVFSLGSLIGIIGIGCFGSLSGASDLLKLCIYAGASMGFGMRISLLSAIPADLFHGRHFGAILGFVNGGGGLGGFIGPFLAGYLFDITGDYQLAFFVSALAIVASAVAAWMASPRHVL